MKISVAPSPKRQIDVDAAVDRRASIVSATRAGLLVDLLLHVVLVWPKVDRVGGKLRDVDFSLDLAAILVDHFHAAAMDGDDVAVSSRYITRLVSEMTAETSDAR